MRTKRILSIGDNYMKGIVIAIKNEDYGWILTIQYKTVPNKDFFVEHFHQEA